MSVGLGCYDGDAGSDFTEGESGVAAVKYFPSQGLNYVLYCAVPARAAEPLYSVQYRRSSGATAPNPSPTS